MKKRGQIMENKNNIHEETEQHTVLTSSTSQEIKRKLNDISKKLIEKNTEAYRKLAVKGKG